MERGDEEMRLLEEEVVGEEVEEEGRGLLVPLGLRLEPGGWGVWLGEWKRWVGLTEVEGQDLDF